ncbi:C-type lectin domain family 4 member F-like [Hemicordylus capensis]|uniref:C-type lectin domain family 4 member F-like n=1 Tax=Hemicordylus capensis TaxID=884348 RepID=UPI0023046C72|nr:C-type lectin domain family 4 member F-like [Hemicordylus capensis]
MLGKEDGRMVQENISGETVDSQADDSQRQTKFQELEKEVEEIRTALQLSNISCASGNESDSSALSRMQLLNNITQTCAETQARLENVSASEAAAQDKYRDLLSMVSSGWKHHGGGFYFFSKETKSWQEAEQACASYGAHLTSVTLRQEMEYLTGETNGEAFYIGLTDQWQEGNWTWVDGTEFNSQVSFWAPGQPDNWHKAPGQREDCVQIRFKNLNAWIDVSCTHNLKWVCKRVFS